MAAGDSHVLLKLGWSLLICSTMVFAVSEMQTALCKGRTEKHTATEVGDKILERVKRYYGKAKEISTCFRQAAKSKFDPGPATDVKGCLYIRRPNKFRWEYEDPSAGPLLVWDGKDLYQYDAIDNVVEVYRGFDSNNLTTALSFLFGKGDLRQEFVVKSTSGPGKGRIRLVLIPRKKPSRFKELVLVVDGRNGRVLETSWDDSYGGENRLVFDEFKLDSGLKDELFVFEVPKGAEVIEQDAVN